MPGSLPKPFVMRPQNLGAAFPAATAIRAHKPFSPRGRGAIIGSIRHMGVIELRLKELLAGSQKEDIAYIAENCGIKLPPGAARGGAEKLAALLAGELPQAWNRVLRFLDRDLAAELDEILRNLPEGPDTPADMTKIFKNPETAILWEDILLSFGFGYETGVQLKVENGKQVYAAKILLPEEARAALRGYQEHIRPDTYYSYDEVSMLSRGMIAYFGVLPFEEFYARVCGLLGSRRISYPECFDLITYNGIFYADGPHMEDGVLCHFTLDDAEELLCLQNDTGMDYRELGYEECLRAARDGFVYAEPQSSMLLRFYIQKGIPCQEAHGILQDLYFDANAAWPETMELALKNSLTHFHLKNERELEEYARLADGFLRAAPCWALKGNSLREQAGEGAESRGTAKVIDFSGGRPCPCGSGKKYKDCCGAAPGQKEPPLPERH